MRGIDYSGPGSTVNRDTATGIRYGIISLHKLGENTDEMFEAEYDACCPHCGEEVPEDSHFTSDQRPAGEVREKYTAALKQEVSTYDEFIQGNVWGYTIEVNHPCGECGSSVHDENEDSCWGFIGSDKSTLEAMKEHVDAKHHEALERAWRNRGR